MFLCELFEPAKLPWVNSPEFKAWFGKIAESMDSPKMIDIEEDFGSVQGTITERAKVKLSTSGDEIGAWVHDGFHWQGKPEKTVILPINKLDVNEPDSKFDDTENAANLKSIQKALKKGKTLPPILVRRVGMRFQILDGHHRFKAYRSLGMKKIPARIIHARNITESVDGHSVIMKLIEIAQKKFGSERLSGGNCGTFALALVRAMNAKGFDPKMGFIYRMINGRPSNTINEVLSAETDIYHVFVMFNGKFYDGDGETTVDAIFSIAENEYGDSDPSDFTDISIDDKEMLMLIDNDTNWTIDAATFKNAMIRTESIMPKKGINESKASSYLQSLSTIDQQERNKYAAFVKANGNDWDKGAQLYAKKFNRSPDDVFGEVARNKEFIAKAKNFDFDNFSEQDWNNFWIVCQHCDFDRAFQKWALGIIKQYEGINDHYKYLYDRISCGCTGTQKYGTQDICNQT